MTATNTTQAAKFTKNESMLLRRTGRMRMRRMTRRRQRREEEEEMRRKCRRRSRRSTMWKGKTRGRECVSMWWKGNNIPAAKQSRKK